MTDTIIDVAAAEDEEPAGAHRQCGVVADTVWRGVA
jgi:hypothetical protein